MYTEQTMCQCVVAHNLKKKIVACTARLKVGQFFFFFKSEFVFRSMYNVAQRRSRGVSTRYD